MDREEIIRMAAEVWNAGSYFPIPSSDDIERFAALVAAYIRENEFKPDWNNYQQGLIDGAAAEREECAAICDTEADEFGGMSDGFYAAKNCAEAIRARGGDA